MRIKVKCIIAMPLIVILILTSCLYIYPRQIEAKGNDVFNGNGFEVLFYLDSVYDGGYNARLELRNTSDQTIEDWTIAFSFEENITNVWNGALKKLEDGKCQIQNAGWNQDIRAGETVTFGFSGSSSHAPKAPANYELIGTQCTADSSEYSIACKLEEQWNTGYIVQVDIKNLTAFTMKDWMLEFTLGNEIESLWGAEVFAHSESTYQVRNNNNQNISAYNTVSFHYIVTSSTYVEPCNFKLYYQSLDNALVESPKPTVSVVTEEPVTSKEPVVTEETVSSEEPAVTGEQPTANPTESVQPADSEIPVTSEAPVTSDPPLESEEPEEEQEIDMTDTDGDGLIDALEEVIGTDSLLADTDGDLLTDYEEVYQVGTDPLLIDTDGNGIMDAYDDIDLDGLANKEELNLGTSAVCTDSDYDGLNDGEEVNQYGTEPLNEDTDGDTITDGDEILLGLSPLLADSDGDGIVDNEEKIEQTFCVAIEDEEKPEVTNVEVAFAGTGNIEDTTEIESVYGEDLYSSNLVGLVGAPIEIETESEFDSATITFSYDESKLGEVDEENLAIMWYDEENHNYVQMESAVDTEKNTVSCETTHFSVYTLINGAEWNKFWNTPIQYHFLNYRDIAVVCENTEEMWNYMNATVTMANNVANNMRKGDHICEIEYGTDACVEFDFGHETEFSFQKTNVDWEDAICFEAEMNGKKSVGEGYNASKGIKLAIEQLNGLNSDNRKSILLFCSGTKLDDMEDVVEMAKKFDIPITTVNIVNGKYSAVLKNIAEETGGTYLDISGYNFSSRDDLYKIANMTLDAFPYIANRESIDTDGDGIPDMYEVLGVKATNGQILYSDPNKADTDDDGLTDKEELNVKKNKKTGEVVAFVCSDPRYKDSDGDSYTDYDELTKYKSNPYKNEVKLYRWNKGYINVDYEGGTNGRWSNGMVSYGGAQRWFFNEDNKKWYSWFTGDYILENKGCGLVSVSDILLYLSKSDNKYATKLTNSVEKDKTGNIEYSTYMNYLHDMGNKYFTVGRYTGVLGTSIATGINLYSYKYDLDLKAKWGVKKNQVLPKIKEMLKNDIPVTLSIGICIGGNGINFYDWDAKDGDKYNFIIYSYKNLVSSHYVTVTGLLVDKVKGQMMLEISSWGKRYYINYQEYTNFVKEHSGYISSNIVYIKR